MSDQYNEKDFEYDKKVAMKIVEKADNKGYEFTDLEISIIQNITRANTYKDVNCNILPMLLRLANKFKIKY